MLLLPGSSCLHPSLGALRHTLTTPVVSRAAFPDERHVPKSVLHTLRHAFGPVWVDDVACGLSAGRGGVAGLGWGGWRHDRS